MGVRANLRIRVKPVSFGDVIQSLLRAFPLQKVKTNLRESIPKILLEKVCLCFNESFYFNFSWYFLLSDWLAEKEKERKVLNFLNFNAFGFKVITNSPHFFWCKWVEEFSFYLWSQLIRFVHLEVLLNLLTMITFFFFGVKCTYVWLACTNHHP